LPHNPSPRDKPWPIADTYAGIAPAGVLAFIVAQLVGALAATVLARWLFQE
jgi:glycerol uptake facilitator-like aquaporin